MKEKIIEAQLFLNGNENYEQSFNYLFNKFKPLMEKVAWENKLKEDYEDTLLICQESFMNCIRIFDYENNNMEVFPNFLKIHMKNRIRKMHQRRNKNSNRKFEFSSFEKEDEFVAEEKSFNLDIFDCLCKTQKDKDLIQLIIASDYTAKQFSKEYNCSERTAKRLKKEMREKMKFIILSEDILTFDKKEKHDNS